jgi:chromosome segregation ATPase
MGPVAEFLRLPAPRAAALEGTLGSLLQALVVRDADAFEEIERWLQAEQSNPEHGDRAHGALALLPRDALPRLEALLEMIRFIGEAPSEPVLLGRRERVERLRQDVEEAKSARALRAAERDAASGRLEEAEVALREVQSSLEMVEIHLRRANADEVNRAGHHGRTLRAREDATRRKEAAVSARPRTGGCDRSTFST